MNEADTNGERKMISVIGIIAWRWGMGIAGLLAAYGAMWVKSNAPSREQFDILTAQVQAVREELIRWSNQKEKVERMEMRFEKLDERMLEIERRATPPRRPPTP